MNTTEFNIQSKENQNKFLQHVGFAHQYGERCDAMIYTNISVAQDLATKYAGIVVPAKNK